MGVLDRLKQYQTLQRLEQPAMEATQEPLTPSHVGGTSQQGNSFLQRFILDMLKAKGVPVTALKFVPGFGEEIHKLLYGDPYQCHTYFADMLYHVQQLLEQDKDWDPVELARRQEFVEAEKRARDRASFESSTSRTFDDLRSDGQWQEHTPGYSDASLSDAIPDVEGADYRQQATVQSTMGNRRPDSEQTL